MVYTSMTPWQRNQQYCMTSISTPVLSWGFRLSICTSHFLPRNTAHKAFVIRTFWCLPFSVVNSVYPRKWAARKVDRCGKEHRKLRHTSNWIKQTAVIQNSTQRYWTSLIWEINELNHNGKLGITILTSLPGKMDEMKVKFLHSQLQFKTFVRESRSVFIFRKM